MSHPLRSLVIAGAFIGLVGAIAGPMVGGPDYSSIPPAPREVFQKISGTQTNLAQAIEIAQRETKGVAKSVQFDLSEQQPTIQVVVYTQETAMNVKIDPANGNVVSQTPVSRFPGAPVEGEPQRTESGLMYYDIRVGEGPQPTGPNAQVKVHYTGWLTDGTKFDSSVDRGEPLVWPLERFIPGWIEGIGSMRVGGKRKLIVPYELAYGEMGRPPVIPSRATLIFDVELLDLPAAPPRPGH